jgi:hypothetical protein
LRRGGVIRREKRKKEIKIPLSRKKETESSGENGSLELEGHVEAKSEAREVRHSTEEGGGS